MGFFCEVPDVYIQQLQQVLRLANLSAVKMVDSGAGCDLKRGGKGAATVAVKLGSAVGWYIPRCIGWSGILWFTVKLFIRFDPCFALLLSLLLTAPLVQLVHSPNLLEPLYREVPADPLPWPEPGTVGWYIPRCIMWLVLVWFNVNAFMHFDLWFALMASLVHTVPLVLLVHFPDILEHLDPPVVARELPFRPASQKEKEEENDEKEYVIVHKS